MEFRSTNAGAHLQGDLVTNVSSVTSNLSSCGIQLTSSNNHAIVQACGDDVNHGLRVRAKGTGTLFIGDSSNSLNIQGTNPWFTASSGVGQNISGSTATWFGPIRFQDTAVATPNFNTTNAMVMETTHAITGVNSSHFVLANPLNLSTDCALLYAYPGSTAGEVHCRFLKASTLTVAASTATINFLIQRF